MRGAKWFYGWKGFYAKSVSSTKHKAQSTKHKASIAQKRRFFKAFSLAEVLITLCVIGVVSAITIPTLISNYQKTQYVEALKKTYTIGNQALVQLANDYRCNGDLACTGLFDPSVTNNDFGDAFAQYFKISKNCRSHSSSYTDVCFPATVSNYYDGSDPRYNPNSTGDYFFITVDGSAYRITNYKTSCAMNAAYGTTGYMTQVCDLLQVDINGPGQGPNNSGRDLFSFYISNGKGPFLYPKKGGGYQFLLEKWSA